MSIRARLILIVILMGLVPTLIALFAVTAQMRRLGDTSQDAIDKITTATIRGKAAATANQIEQYLANHPEIDPSDMTTLMADQDLEVIAVQPVVGDSGYTAVFDASAITYFHPNPEIVGVDLETLGADYPEFWRIIKGSLYGVSSEGDYDWPEPDGTVKRKFMAIEPVGDTPLRVAATAYHEELTRPVQDLTETMREMVRLTQLNFILFALGVAVVAIVVAVTAAASFTDPLREIAEAAGRAMKGEWDAIRPFRRSDEMGKLSLALYDMTGRMRELVQSLEQEVSARTAELDRRMHYLETTGEIASAMTGVVDLPRLFAQTVTSISHRFGHYHAGVFLLNPTGEWAVLEAASSEEGQRMLSEGYQVRVGQEDNAVGYATAWGTSRVVSARESAPSVRVLSWLSPLSQRDRDAEGSEAPVNPDLPETRTEMALPLRARGEVVGALDIQSTEENAFSDEDVIVLQALADQLAVAISNARLFQQAQESLEAERRAYGEASREAWRKMLLARPDLGFVRDERGLFPAGDVWSEDVALREEATALDGDGASHLATPIRVRGNIIGVIDTYKPAGAGTWTSEEITLLESLADQLGTALEGARLYQEAQRRAVRERLTSEITDKMRRAASVEGIVQTAVDELFNALGTSRAFVRLGTVPSTQDGGEDEPQ
jgi:GAF domain-containing protein/HAMP domain-containing protein